MRTYSGTLTDAINDTRYTYDPFGRLKTVSVVERFNTQLGSPETTTYGYDRAEVRGCPMMVDLAAP